jgi:hypothetical protein
MIIGCLLSSPASYLSNRMLEHIYGCHIRKGSKSIIYFENEFFLKAVFDRSKSAASILENKRLFGIFGHPTSGSFLENLIAAHEALFLRRYREKATKQETIIHVQNNFR